MRGSLSRIRDRSDLSPRTASPAPEAAAAAERRPGRGRAIIQPARFRARLAALCGVLWLGGCVETGDFGRPRPTVWSESVLPLAGRATAAARGEPVSWAPYTDDERELRDRAWRFLMPAHERAWFETLIAEAVRTRILPVSARPADKAFYHRALTSVAFRSPASRYSRLAGDAEADMRLIDPFAATAARVIASDRARLASLAYVRDITEEQVESAASRVAENRCIIAWVREEVVARSAGYRYALEHLFLEMPQVDAVRAERALRRLEEHGRTLDGLPVPRLGLGVCGDPGPGSAEPLPPPAPGPLVVKG